MFKTERKMHSNGYKWIGNLHEIFKIISCYNVTCYNASFVVKKNSVSWNAGFDFEI